MVLFGSDTIKIVIKLILLMCLAALIILSIQINDKDNDLLILVNKENPMKTDYNLNLRSYKNKYVAKELVKPLREMEKELKKENFALTIKDAYVSIQYQQTLFDNSVKRFEKQGFSNPEAKIKTASTVLLPRYSEHHTALAIDLEDEKNLYEWLEDNAYKYGFILRYPKEKENITKYPYNQNHYRYVGYEVAQIIHQNNLCLEEYLEIYKGEKN